MSTAQSSPGFYGKVPVLGDFVSRRLPPHFIRPWDAWLQSALSESREQLGSGWLDVYLTSPIWRFALGPGNCGTEGWAGILMPSVDKVGRYFPLTLAVAIQEEEILPWLLFAGAQWFDRLEELALSVLEENIDFDGFDRELQTVALPQIQAHRQKCIATNMMDRENGPFAFHVGMEGLGQVQEAFVHLNSCLLVRSMPAFTLWCTSGSDRVKPSLLAYDGLPPISAYSKLLTGHWQEENRDIQDIRVEAPSSDTVKRYPTEATTLRERIGVEHEPSLHWSSSASTTVGCVRKINEDSYLDRPEIGLWAVADGMGGHNAGDEASKAVVNSLSSIPGGGTLETFAGRVSACLKKVNADLLQMGDKYGAGQIVGSTVVVMLAMRNRCAAIWLGDSRLYRYRDGALQQLTRDHSLVAELSDMGVSSQEGLAGGEAEGVLTRALGADETIAIEAISFNAREGDIFLLCSDGLMREVESAEVVEIFRTSRFEDIGCKLIELALAHGARDNVTVVIVGASPGGPGSGLGEWVNG